MCSSDLPDLHPGKVLVHHSAFKDRLLKQRETARKNKNREEEQRLNDLIQMMDAGPLVGHHYDPLEIAAMRGKRKRKPIFLQYNRDEDVPVETPKILKNVGGGFHPNKKVPLDNGPGTSDITNAIENLSNFIDSPATFERFVKEFIQRNYYQDYNIFFKTFIDEKGNVISQSTYDKFKNLIRNKALRNISLFDLTSEERARYITTMISRLNKLATTICDHLLERELGHEQGTLYTRVGQIADAATVEEAMDELMAKTGSN